jgi:hypothetical protein
VLETLVACGITLAGSILLGTGVLRAIGWAGSNWLSGAVGLALAVCIAAPMLRVPGGVFTVAFVLVLGLVASVLIIAKSGGLQVSAGEGLVFIPPLVLTSLPFLANERTGILGVSVNNDMASHLLVAEAFRSSAVFDVRGVPEAYPIGPHALAAAIAEPLGLGTAEAFTGVTMASLILVGLTALSFLGRTNLVGRLAVVTLAGSPFLLLAYYGQGSFKEAMMAAFVLGVTATLLPSAKTDRLMRWLPYAILLAGIISVYSYNGLLWPGLTTGLWFAGRAAVAVRDRRAGFAEAWLAVRAGAVPVILAGAAFVALTASQVPRVLDYIRDTGGGTDPGGSPVGNLLARLPFWEAFGVWNAFDYRVVPIDALTAGAWAGFLCVVAVVASAWWVRRGDWVVPLMVVVAVIVWVYLDRAQTPYLAAKGLAILSPQIALVTLGPFVTSDGWLRKGAPYRLLIGIAVVVVGMVAVRSSFNMIRAARVGPLGHVEQLRTFAPVIGKDAVLFLGNDDFLRWALPLASARAPVIADLDVPTRPEKAFEFGQNLDVDSVPTEELNASDYLITTNDPASSDVPKQFAAIKRSRDFVLYRRIGRVPHRVILPEGQEAYAVLNCDSKFARSLLRTDALAAVRKPQVSVGVPGTATGASTTVRLRLPKGNWKLSLQYTSGRSFTVAVPGGQRRMPANQDRPGPRYLAGGFRLERTTNVPIRFSVDGNRLSSVVEPLLVQSLIAVPSSPARLVPVRRACDRPVDYLLGA